jgi:oligopeptide/dipeptide ABC transporter ATP-binding protein
MPACFASGMNRVTESPPAVLQIRGLRTSFDTPAGVLTAVAGVDLELRAGECVALVGESGSGKTATALSLLGLLPPTARIEAGEVWFEGRDLLQLSQEELRKVRGNRLAMIFQEPMTSLNPVFTIGDQIEEVLRWHTELPRGQRRARVLELLELVGFPEPRAHARSYPHALSGGMRQRAMIAMALACNPVVLIADEPTTALDVTIQAQILALIRSLQERFQMAVLLITHDLGVVSETADRVVVLYAGRVAESGPARLVLGSPRHPYTAGLLRSIPGRGTGHRARLAAIVGSVPDLLQRPRGCAFRERCARASGLCSESEPERIRFGERAVACHHPESAGGSLL